MHATAKGSGTPVLGITGTGGAGKSSLTDELIRRLRLDQDDRLRIAVISIDPSRRKSGGALLGDRIRMNAIAPWRDGPRVYMRSLATREAGSEISAALPDVIAACKAAGFDLVIVETSGIGQGDAAIVPLVDVPMYVMTPEFGAASQLEKIDMLDFAEFVAINKFDRKGAADALRDVGKQVQRNRQAFGKAADQMPVYGTIASRFNDDGVTALYQALLPRLSELGLNVDSTTRRAACRVSRHATARTKCRSCPGLVCVTSPKSPTPCAATSSAHAHSRASRARSSSCAPARACSATRSPSVRKPPRRSSTSLNSARRNSTPAPRSCSRCGRRCRSRTPATNTS